MLIGEAHQAFKLELDKIDSLNYPDILPEEIDYYLNEAQDTFVKQRYGGTNSRKQSFEQSQKRIDDLRTLVLTSNIVPLATNPNNIDPNAQFVNMPGDYWFLVQERATVTYNDCKGIPVTKRVDVIATTHDSFNEVINNPFKKPNTEKVLRLMANGFSELVHAPNVVINIYHIRYIKEPVRVSLVNNISFELPEHTHQEIVNQAVSLALESIESVRIRTFDPIVKNQEE